jgi:hypothetical protein
MTSFESVNRGETGTERSRRNLPRRKCAKALAMARNGACQTQFSRRLPIPVAAPSPGMK